MTGQLRKLGQPAASPTKNRRARAADCRQIGDPERAGATVYPRPETIFATASANDSTARPLLLAVVWHRRASLVSRISITSAIFASAAGQGRRRSDDHEGIAERHQHACRQSSAPNISVALFLRALLHGHISIKPRRARQRNKRSHVSTRRPGRTEFRLRSRRPFATPAFRPYCHAALRKLCNRPHLPGRCK